MAVQMLLQLSADMGVNRLGGQAQGTAPTEIVVFLFAFVEESPI
jgi:hypothetical protein